MSRPEGIPEDVWEAASAVATRPIVTGALFSDNYILPLARALMAERAAQKERDAMVAALYIINGNSIHPDIPQANMSETAKMVAHTTCQHVAEAIRKATP